MNFGLHIRRRTFHVFCSLLMDSRLLGCRLRHLLWFRHNLALSWRLGNIGWVGL